MVEFLMSRKKKRLPTDSEEGLAQNPFGALNLDNLPEGRLGPP